MNSDFCENSASIHLDYGADSAAFDFSSLHICTQGMRLKTRWFFEPGTELSVNFQLGEPDGTAPGRLLKTEGIVAECQEDEDGREYEVTVVFLEVTDDIMTVIRDLVPSAALHG